MAYSILESIHLYNGRGSVMSFVKNDSSQVSFDDSTVFLTEREKRFLDKSWAKAFREKIFPAIREEDFAVLYSDRRSRPNTPVNVIIGILILKEIMELTDDEAVESLIFDIRFQYALHTTSFKEQPISTRTLSRFRKRCLTYETITGIDLIKNSILELSPQIVDIMGAATGLKLMDSMAVVSNIKKLSRLELLYISVVNLVRLLHKNEGDIEEGMKHYLESSDLNEVIVHTRSAEIGEKTRKLFEDASFLINKYAGHYDESSEYQLLVRVIDEQANEDKRAEGSP